jgi:hypothetical protein
MMPRKLRVNASMLSEAQTMKQSERDAGTIAALMIRLQDYRLPRAQRMLEKVQQGAVLSDEDLQFLERVFADARHLKPLVERNPKYLPLVSRMIDLYGEIVARSLENENNPAR